MDSSASSSVPSRGGVDVGGEDSDDDGEVTYPSEIDGTYSTAKDAEVSGTLMIMEGSAMLTAGGTEGSGNVTAWDEGTKTLTVTFDEMGEVEFTYDEAAKTLSGDPFELGEATVFTFGTIEEEEDGSIPDTWRFVWASSNGDYKLDLTGDVLVYTEMVKSGVSKTETKHNIEEYTFENGTLTFEVVYGIASSTIEVTMEGTMLHVSVDGSEVATLTKQEA